MYRQVAAPIVILLFASSLGAQVRGMTPSPGFGNFSGTPARGIRTSFGELRPRHRFRDNGLIFGSPFLYDYADYQPEPAPAQAAPQVVVLPSAPSAAPPTPLEPLLLERQGDKWVRVSVSDFSAAGGSQTGDSQAPLKGATRRKVVQPPQELPPTVLIFADGHRQEVSHYSIIGKALYTDADYWTTGSWTKKIFVSSLDLPATFQANQERGLKFVLPSGPNEVILRP